MQLQQLILASLLLAENTCYGRAAPRPRQLPRPENPKLNPLAARQPQPQAPTPASEPLTFSTTTTSTTTSAAVTSTVAPVDPATTTSTTISSTTSSTSSTTTTTTSSPASATPTGPRNHNIAVGQNGTTFTPSTLKNIPTGSSLTFYFYPTNYSIVQSSFDQPCQPLGQRAIFSGFNLTPNHDGIARQKFMFNVTSTETMWFYAIDGELLLGAGANVCERGMAMVLNPLPKEDPNRQTLSAYKRNAANPEMNGNGVHRCPAAIYGGEVRGVSDKEKARWESKHPVRGVVANSTAAGDDDNNNNIESEILNYESSAAGRGSSGNSLMAIGVLLGAGVFGLGF
ncbi:hypothetical protein LTS08_005309 [Lithohypha guttulata]|nr:hypothetical protein LTS08_005309 [Lithohypha guttulata]